MNVVVIRNHAHRAALIHRDNMLREFREHRGDFNGGFRSSIPTMTVAQRWLDIAEAELTRVLDTP